MPAPLPHSTFPLAQLARQEEAIENLERWQERQNSSLDKLAKKVDELKTWIMMALLSAVLSLVGVIAQILTHGSK